MPDWLIVLLLIFVTSFGWLVIVGAIFHVRGWLEDREFAKRTDCQFAASMRMSLSDFHKEHGKAHASFWRWRL